MSEKVCGKCQKFVPLSPDSQAEQDKQALIRSKKAIDLALNAHDSSSREAYLAIIYANLEMLDFMYGTRTCEEPQNVVREDAPCVYPRRYEPNPQVKLPGKQ